MELVLLALLGAGLVSAVAFIIIGVLPALARVEDGLDWLLQTSDEKLQEVDTKLAADDTIYKDFLHAALEQIAPHVDSASDPAILVLTKALHHPKAAKLIAAVWGATPAEITPAEVAQNLGPIVNKLIALTDDIPGNVSLS